ncbi:MAG TPA: carbon-nitrogen hydrolase family protein [Candidatus Saccharimonadales bacterium]|nr:carbon-nitrogen hydrolase family protein [Candidatus Saccharimonadales bacterium]
MLPESLTIGIIQFRTIPGQVERNLESTSALIESAKRSGAEVVVLPEMWPTGYGDIDYRSLSEPIPGRYTEYLMRHAIRHRINLVAGMPERANGNELYNTSIFISDEGKIVAKHRKIHLYTPMGEDKIWRSGNSYTVADTKIGRIGLLTCYDGDFPESWRATSLMGAQVIFQINAYESPCEDWWNKFYPSAALQNVVWGILCNAVGNTSGKKPAHFFGQSRIIAPDGQIEAEAPYIAPGDEAESFLLIKTILVKSRFEEARNKFGNFLRDRRPHTYTVIGQPLS